MIKLSYKCTFIISNEHKTFLKNMKSQAINLNSALKQSIYSEQTNDQSIGFLEYSKRNELSSEINTFSSVIPKTALGYRAAGYTILE